MSENHDFIEGSINIQVMRKSLGRETSRLSNLKILKNQYEKKQSWDLKLLKLCNELIHPISFKRA